jgi:ATP-dependent Clp protease ATP-binding subunit ClpC
MFERFTESARRALFFARAEVATLGGSAIETDHLLLGVLRAASDVSWRLCAEAGVTYERARAEAKRRTTSAHRDPASVEIPFSRDAKQVLEHAAQEADRLLHFYVGTEHLLLGLLHGAEHPAAAILSAHGMKLEAVRDHVVRLLNQRGAASSRAVGGVQGAVSGGALDDRHTNRFERLRGLTEQLAPLVDRSPEALALLVEIQMELDELEKS